MYPVKFTEKLQHHDPLMRASVLWTLTPKSRRYETNGITFAMHVGCPVLKIDDEQLIEVVWQAVCDKCASTEIRADGIAGYPGAQHCMKCGRTWTGQPELGARPLCTAEDIRKSVHCCGEHPCGWCWECRGIPG